MRHENYANDSKLILQSEKSHTTITVDLDELSNGTKLLLKKNENKQSNASKHESSKYGIYEFHQAGQSTHLIRTDARGKGDQQNHARSEHRPGIGKDSGSKEHLPPLKLVGFDQEAKQTSEGLAGDVVRELKDTLFGAEKISDRIRAKVIEDLTPSERQKLIRENQENQNSKTGGDAALNVWFSSPMQEIVDARTKNIEEKITEKVRSSMSPAELARLDKQLYKFEQDKIANENYRKATHHPVMSFSPLVNVTAALMAPPKAEPGAAVKNYMDRIKEESEIYLNR